MVPEVTIFLLLAAALALGAPDVPAETEASAPLVVGVKPAPPFVIAHEDGTWGGIGVMLWRAAADDLGLQYRFERVDLEAMLGGLERGSLDVGVAALTVTAEREAAFDFTQPYFPGGLGIAVPSDEGSMLSLDVVDRLFSRSFLQAIGALGAVLLLAGTLVWLFERRANEDEFGGSVPRGLAESFWWSAVTMTTVGYGDRSPRTLGGRTVALVWMFASVIMISSFTAAISSALTVGSLGSSIEGPEDLDKLTVGTVAASTSAGWLRSERVDARELPNPRTALRALADGEIEAVVYDAAVLRYLILEAHEGELRVLERTFEPQSYAFGLREDLSIREELDRALLSRMETAWWRAALFDHLRRSTNTSGAN